MDLIGFQGLAPGTTTMGSVTVRIYFDKEETKFTQVVSTMLFSSSNPEQLTVIMSEKCNGR